MRWWRGRPKTVTYVTRSVVAARTRLGTDISDHLTLDRMAAPRRWSSGMCTPRHLTDGIINRGDAGQPGAIVCECTVPRLGTIVR